MISPFNQYYPLNSQLQVFVLASHEQAFLEAQTVPPTVLHSQAVLESQSQTVRALHEQVVVVLDSQEQPIDVLLTQLQLPVLALQSQSP